MAKYIGKEMSIGTFEIKQCKLVLTVTVLCAHNFVCMNMCIKTFYQVTISKPCLAYQDLCTYVLLVLIFSGQSKQRKIALSFSRCLSDMAGRGGTT